LNNSVDSNLLLIQQNNGRLVGKIRYTPSGLYDLIIAKTKDVQIWHEANARTLDIMDDVKELADSIDSIGLQNPPLAQKVDDVYFIITGQRRLKAFEYLGEKRIPLLILKDPFDIKQAKLASIIENLHRNAMNPKDIMNACQFLKSELGSVKKASNAIGISQQTFRNYLQDKKLPAYLQEKIGKGKGKISRPDARRIAEIVSDKERGEEVSKRISEMTKYAKDRYFTALQEAPTASHKVIEKRAERLKIKNKITFHLQDPHAIALGRASEDNDEEPEYIAKNALLDWLKRRGYVKTR